MKYARQILVGFYIFILVFSFLAIGGCEHWGWRNRDQNRNYDERGERGGNLHNEENRGGYH